MPIAVALAILLPVEVQQTAQRLNERFGQSGNQGFRFDESHRPHITLGQHFVSKAKFPEIRTRIDELVSEHEPIEIHVTGAQDGRTAQILSIKRVAPLQRLHEAAMDAMAPYELSTSEPDSFQSDGVPPRSADILWVATFRNRSSYGRYAPHITIGIGTQPFTIEPFQFTAHEIAMYQLGRFCTCRNQLARWSLQLVTS